MFHYLMKAMQRSLKGNPTKQEQKTHGLMDTPQPSVSQPVVGTTNKAVQMDNSTKLSRNFTLGEFTASAVASRNGVPNQPNAAQFQNLKNLCTGLLQPLRDKLKRPMIVSSGFRSQKLNDLLSGASDTSQHMLGEAADISVPGLTAAELARYIIDLGLEFDQLILEYYEGPGTGWVHVSYSEGSNEKEVLTSNSSGIRPGLHVS